MAKTSKSKSVINPVDAEITEILDNVTPEIVKSKFQEAVDNIQDNQLQPEKVDAENIVQEINEINKDENTEINLGSRYILTEIVYIIESKDDLPAERLDTKFDFTEILLDLETVLAIERVYEKRLIDFGITEEDIDDLSEAHDREMLDACIVHCSAFTDAIIVTDYTFEELISILIKFRNEKC